ncbi:MAG: hypothetical protein EOO45_20175 [Flavobacterium sp.]|nr:MAG: hypothetical protein EOO45_20175 [Flavobacterium sp.]
MEIFLSFLSVVFAVLAAGYFTVFLFRNLLEPFYILVFNRPIFVHFYPFPKHPDPAHVALLNNEFNFYRNLTPRRKGYFRHRVATFMVHYRFVGAGGLTVTDEMKVRIAAVSVMLTFGMRRYLYRVFSRIIIYPDVFPSRSDDNFHKGEFNPAAKAIVFSWKHFLEGLQHDSDNLNLGLHEFAHALHFDSLRKQRRGSSAAIYKDGFNNILVYLGKPSNRQQLIDAGYLREYAYTNQHEFVAVVLEYFFETPDEFRQRLPELHEIVKRMINFRD